MSNVLWIANIMRVQLLFVFCTLLGLAVTLPVEKSNLPTRNTALEQTVLDLIESLRDIMRQGTDDIPVLDPLEVDYLHLDLESLLGLPNAHVAVSKAMVKELSTFVVDDLKISMTSIILQRYSLDLEGHIPVIEAEVDNYDLEVTVANVHVYGNGNAKAKIIEPRVKVSMEIGISLIGGISVNIRSSQVQFFLAGFEPELTGMFDGDEFTNDFVNLFLSNLVPELVEFYEPEITEILSNLVLTIGNEILGNLDISDILGKSGVLQHLHLEQLEKAADTAAPVAY